MAKGIHVKQEDVRRAVASITSGERLASDVAVELGVSVKTVGDWVRRAKQRAKPVPRTSPGEAALKERIAELERTLAEEQARGLSNKQSWAEALGKMQDERDALKSVTEWLLEQLLKSREGS